jgi:glycosyltransferase involved in cell wall biosynthesis
VESAIFSDINVIGSNFGKEIFLKASLNQKLADKIIVIPPPTNVVLNNNFIECTKNSKILTLMYNHRLYKHYGTIKIFEELKKINKDIPFKVIVTDPTANRSILRNNIDRSVLEIKKYLNELDFVEIKHFKTQSEYITILNSIDIGLGHLRKGALWSMSIADMMANGIPVLGFNNGGISEIIQDKNLLFNSLSQFNRILRQLLIDEEFRTKKGQNALALTKIFNTNEVVNNFESVFLNFLKLKN